MNPVAARAKFWGTESFSAGRERSLTPAMTRAHLAVRCAEMEHGQRVGHYTAITAM